jgi:hypothetical protein
MTSHPTMHHRPLRGFSRFPNRCGAQALAMLQSHLDIHLSTTSPSDLSWATRTCSAGTVPAVLQKRIIGRFRSLHHMLQVQGLVGTQRQSHRRPTLGTLVLISDSPQQTFFYRDLSNVKPKERKPSAAVVSHHNQMPQGTGLSDWQ